MPIITGLQSAVSNADRVNIFIDGKFSFSLTISELADSKLARGQDLTEEEIKKYRTLSCTGKLYQQALEYCFSRPHSKKEIIDSISQGKNPLITQKSLDGISFFADEEILVIPTIPDN